MLFPFLTRHIIIKMIVIFWLIEIIRENTHKCVSTVSLMLF